MNLFDETENKYYEFLSCILQDGKSYGKKEVNDKLEEFFSGELDFDVTETIFAEKEGEELIFSFEENEFIPIMQNDFPIRSNLIEQQAVKTLLTNEYLEQFLSKETIEKLQDVTEEIQEDWTPEDIYVKNIFSGGISENPFRHGQSISLIARTIIQQKAIVYDNVKPDYFEYRDQLVFPLKIEFSVVNDQFRICAYEPVQRRFIKMNLETMQNIKTFEETCEEDLQVEYKEYLKSNTKSVKLDVEPVNHVIERCFRIFSYYDRKARYDKEEGKYRLEISYLKSDENEIIKDILSLGGYVTVMEPRQLQKEVYRRILAASKLYEN